MTSLPVSTPVNPGLMTASSAALHALVLVAVIWRAVPHPPDPPSEAASIQVEYVNQTAAVKGVTNPDESAPPMDDPTPGDAPTMTAVAPAPANPFADVPMPPEALPSDANAVHAGRPTNAAGNAVADRDALTVIGRNMVSSGPDAAYRNMPPNYPRDAVRAHQQGSVQVSVHISPSGMPDDVKTLISSGSEALDNAVRDAVLKWHFKPALQDGKAVASVYRLQMNFRSQAQ